MRVVHAKGFITAHETAGAVARSGGKWHDTSRKARRGEGVSPVRCAAQALTSTAERKMKRRCAWRMGCPQRCVRVYARATSLSCVCSEESSKMQKHRLMLWVPEEACACGRRYRTSRKCAARGRRTRS